MSTPTSAPARTSRPGLEIPLALLLVALLLNTGYQTISLARQHQRFAAAERTLYMPATHRELLDARALAAKVEALAQGVVNLAPTNANARRIVEEYHIQGAPKR
jgi:hypothetical protein